VTDREKRKGKKKEWRRGKGGRGGKELCSRNFQLF